MQARLKKIKDEYVLELPYNNLGSFNIINQKYHGIMIYIDTKLYINFGNRNDSFFRLNILNETKIWALLLISLPKIQVYC